MNLQVCTYPASQAPKWKAVSQYQLSLPAFPVFFYFIFSLSLHVDGLIIITSQKPLSGKCLKCFLQLFVFCLRNRNGKLACIFLMGKIWFKRITLVLLGKNDLKNNSPFFTDMTEIFLSQLFSSPTTNGHLTRQVLNRQMNMAKTRAN